MTTPDRPSPPLRPTPLLLTGVIDEIDTPGRSLRIGSHRVEVPEAVSLDRLRAGDRVVVKGMREPISGRVLGLEIVSAHPSQRSSSEDKSRPVRILSLVVGLLAELGPDAHVLDCQLLPGIHRYAIRIELPGAQDRAVLMPRKTLEAALADPDAQRIVRNVLQATVTVLRGHRAIRASRRDLSHDVDGGSSPGPRCVRCEGPLSAEDPIIAEAGSQGHLACPPLW